MRYLMELLFSLSGFDLLSFSNHSAAVGLSVLGDDQ